jgi:hypothetical protein
MEGSNQYMGKKRNQRRRTNQGYNLDLVESATQVAFAKEIENKIHGKKELEREHKNKFTISDNKNRISENETQAIEDLEKYARSAKALEDSAIKRWWWGKHEESLRRIAKEGARTTTFAPVGGRHQDLLAKIKTGDASDAENIEFERIDKSLLQADCGTNNRFFACFANKPSPLLINGGYKHKNTRRKNTRHKNTRRKNTRRKNTRRKNTRRKNTRRKNTRRKNTRRKNTRRKNTRRKNTRRNKN